MNSIKLNKKHLFSILITLVLLFSLNLNTFASGYSSAVVDFTKQNFIAFSNGKEVSGVSASSKNREDIGHYCQYKFPLGIYNSYMVVSGSPDLYLYLDTQYEFEFYTFCPTDYTLNLNFSFTNNENVSVKGLTLVDGEFKGGQYNLHKGIFNIDKIDDVTKYAFIFSFVTYDDSLIDFFCISDLKVNAIGPLYGEPIITPNTDDLENTLDDYENVMNELPSINGDELDSLMNFDFSSFTDGLAFVRDMFNRTMSVFGFNAVLVFALTIGLATYIVGRKVG